MVEPLHTYPLEKDLGRRYEQLVGLAKSAPDWSTFEATAERSREVCIEVLERINTEQAVLEPIHLSKLKLKISGIKINPQSELLFAHLTSLLKNERDAGVQ